MGGGARRPRCSRPALGLAAFVLLLASDAAAQRLAGRILWNSRSGEFASYEATPGRVRHLARAGEQFVVVAAELEMLDPALAQAPLRLAAGEIRLRAASESYPLVGTFEESGAVSWATPSLWVLPAGKARLQGIFSVARTDAPLRLELGDHLSLELPSPVAWPRVAERLEVRSLRARWLGAPLDAVAGPADLPAKLEPWPGQRLLELELVLGLVAPASPPFSLTSADVVLEGNGRVYHCAGSRRAPDAAVRTGASSIVLTGQDGVAGRLRLVYSVAADETQLSLGIGDLRHAVTIE